jgi:hypothetical protein
MFSLNTKHTDYQTGYSVSTMDEEQILYKLIVLQEEGLRAVQPKDARIMPQEASRPKR